MPLKISPFSSPTPLSAALEKLDMLSHIPNSQVSSRSEPVISNASKKGNIPEKHYCSKNVVLAPKKTVCGLFKPSTVSSAENLALLAHYISDNKWAAFLDHVQVHPADVHLADPRTGRPLLYHAIDLHRNDFAHFIINTYLGMSTKECGRKPISAMEASLIAPLGDALAPAAEDFEKDMNLPTPPAITKPHRAMPLRDFQGNTPLLQATHAKNHEIVDYILRKWPQTLDTANVHGVTPLLEASAVGSELLVGLFLDRGADSSHMDQDGNTALHLAAAYNHFGVVALLVARGANFMVRNKRRWMPLDYAYSETLQSFLQDLVRDVVLGDNTDAAMELSQEAAARAAAAAVAAAQSVNIPTAGALGATCNAPTPFAESMDGSLFKSPSRLAPMQSSVMLNSLASISSKRKNRQSHKAKSHKGDKSPLFNAKAALSSLKSIRYHKRSTSIESGPFANDPIVLADIPKSTHSAPLFPIFSSCTSEGGSVPDSTNLTLSNPQLRSYNAYLE